MTPAPIKERISLDYLDKVDIRVGTVLAVDYSSLPVGKDIKANLK
jgi:hypothetical protein